MAIHESVQSTGIPVFYEFTQQSIFKGTIASESAEHLGVHISVRPNGEADPINLFLKAEQAMRLFLGLWDSLQHAIDKAQPGDFAMMQHLVGNRRLMGCQVDGLFKFRRQKEFKVVAVSSNRGSFGHTGHILMARDGTTFEVAVSDMHVKKKGDIVSLKVVDDMVECTQAFFFETPEKMADAPPGVIREVWGE